MNDPQRFQADPDRADANSISNEPGERPSLIVHPCWRFLICWGVLLIAGSARAATETASPDAETESPAAASSNNGESRESKDGESQAGQTTRFQGRAGFFERLPPRAERTPEERKQLAAELREKYAKPPAEWPAPTIDEGVEWQELGLLPKLTFPEQNPFTKEKALLGRQLFFDPRLSQTREMACASCHDPDLAWADGRTVSFGLGRQPLRRNAPSILNAAWMKTYFWDGRAATLEEQAEQVLLNPQEMGSSEALLKERLSGSPAYREAFREVFGDEEITLERVAMALATFERTLVGGQSPFDAFLRGQHEALSEEALLGLDLFRREARCMNCHHGPTLSDGKFHDVGLSYYGRALEDRGRYAITGEAADVGRFRTPTLRNITRTGPYMHNGVFPLAGVLRMYNAGMPTLTPRGEQQEDPLFPKKSPQLRPLGLNAQDLADLEAFLKALEEPRQRMRPPSLPGMGAESQPAAETAAAR